MKNIMAYQVYLNKRQSDYRTSLTLLEQNEIDFDIVCFHFQQFIEKYPKVFLIYHRVEA